VGMTVMRLGVVVSAALIPGWGVVFERLQAVARTNRNRTRDR
jgi:hypothetical protein